MQILMRSSSTTDQKRRLIGIDTEKKMACYVTIEQTKGKKIKLHNLYMVHKKKHFHFLQQHIAKSYHLC